MPTFCWATETAWYESCYMKHPQNGAALGKWAGPVQDSHPRPQVFMTTLCLLSFRGRLVRNPLHETAPKWSSLGGKWASRQAPSRIRTSDLKLTVPTLYQLRCRNLLVWEQLQQTIRICVLTLQLSLNAWINSINSMSQLNKTGCGDTEKSWILGELICSHIEYTQRNIAYQITYLHPTPPSVDYFYRDIFNANPYWILNALQ